MSLRDKNLCLQRNFTSPFISLKYHIMKSQRAPNLHVLYANQHMFSEQIYEHLIQTLGSNLLFHFDDILAGLL